MKILIGWTLILSSLAILFTHYYFPLFEFAANLAGVTLIISIFYTAIEMGLEINKEPTPKGVPLRGKTEVEE